MSDKIKVFEIQMPNNLIRDNTFDCNSFVAYGKLLQLYWQNGQKPLLKFQHKMFMAQMLVNDNRTFKRILDDLYERNLIKTKVNKLPRKELLELELNDYFNIKKQGKNKEDRFMFAKLPYCVFEYPIVNEITTYGVRLLYYYKSYINTKMVNKNFCYTAYETIEKETGLSDKTIKKYNDELERLKFVKIVRHELKTTYNYIETATGDCLEYKKYNNHYFIEDSHEQRIIKFYNKKILNIKGE